MRLSYALLFIASCIHGPSPLVHAAPTANQAPTVTVKNGTYTGTYNGYYDQDLFLGMPYAQPPLGNLRFNLPVSLNASFPGSKDATAYSPECVGYGV